MFNFVITYSNFIACYQMYKKESTEYTKLDEFPHNPLNGL